MAKEGCKYSGNIPKEMMKGKIIHYYIAGLTSTGKVVASSGSVPPSTRKNPAHKANRCSVNPGTDFNCSSEGNGPCAVR